MPSSDLKDELGVGTGGCFNRHRYRLYAFNAVLNYAVIRTEVMHILARRTCTKEFGLFEEEGAIVLGSLFEEGGRPRSVNVQIDLPSSDQREDRWGMYVAIDEANVFYAVVKAFKYRQADKVIEIVLDPARSAGVDSITLEVPHTASENDLELLRKLVHVYDTYPPLEGPWRTG